MPARCLLMVATIFVSATLSSSTLFAQANAVDNELKRLNGHWRVIEMVENGNSIPEAQMREWLPGGGVLEIIDYTILFKSPMDGTKSTKRLRLDPTAYPKQVAIMERDNLTGAGIYKFDQGKLIICVTKETSTFPTEFTAGAGSGRTLIVLKRFDPGQADIPGLNIPIPNRKPIEQVSARVSLPAPPLQEVAAPAAPNPAPPQPIVAGTAAGRVLSDAEVRAMAIGTWRMTDGEGSIDITLQPDGVFRTFRYLRTISNFHVVFAPTPVSAGVWSITNGRLMMTVTSSTRADKVNQAYGPTIRSISSNDVILVDHLGRVTRAAKTN